MAENYLLIYSEQLATNIALLCQNIKAPSNTLFQIRKSSSSVYANTREANYEQSKGEAQLNDPRTGAFFHILPPRHIIKNRDNTTVFRVFEVVFPLTNRLTSSIMVI